MIRIGVSVPVWKRQQLTYAVARYWDRMDVDGVEFDFVAVVSRDEDERIIKAATYWETVLSPNRPLSQKHTDGVRHFRDRDVDAVMHLNSDDIITPSYFEIVRRAVDIGFDAVRLTDYVFYDIPTGRCARCVPALPGSGVVMTRDLLGRIKWEPWPKPANKMLDTMLFRTLKDASASVHMVEHSPDVQNVGFKSVDNIWAFDDIISRIDTVTSVNPAQYFQRHFPWFYYSYAESIFHNAVQ